ncbi:acetyltransferase [Acidovorax sp. SUPP1855]|uniref:GNAT family N-acetyltransferase n=1 Tax=Acidovorax sp. SUPP1855 TaxID=431774 RepID=UPI0023DE351C|nr:GNAT family N-acetyltransferase [Acidovorax sp. SUPP1855]GKS83148.1 acetyltransferase [Acidovorax sp. SUPP1855]
MRQTSQRHIAYADGKTAIVQCEDDKLRLDFKDGHAPSLWKLNPTTHPPCLQWMGSCSAAPNATESLAALEAAFQLHPEAIEFRLSMPQLAPGLRDGIVDLSPSRPPRVARSVLWQQQRLWLPQPRPPYALHYKMTGERRHPVRPAHPQNTVYRRFIPWLGRTLSLRTVDPDADLPTFHRWMNDPTVAHFWEESGDLGHHRAYLQRIAGDPHAVGLIGCFDGQPFGYFEAYWAKEDRIAPFYDAGDHDRGWHALVGEAEFRGQPYLTAWLPSLSHYLFLDDCRTQRIVVEPRSDNLKMRKNLPRCGYALLKEFDFPHKRAVLGVLLRERFFADALWIPQSDAAAPDASTQ